MNLKRINKSQFHIFKKYFFSVSEYEMSPMRARLKYNLMKKFGRRHLDVPKPGDGPPGDSAALVRGRRPSIAPVPAMFGQDESSEEEEDEEEQNSSSSEKEEVETREQEEQRKEEDEEKYLDIQWVTPAENCE